MTLATADRKRSLSDKTKVIGLVSSGHFFAHFYVIVLPPLFPLLQKEFGVSYSALGLLLTVSSVTTGLIQVPVGFLVDRFGARRLLMLGLLCMSAAVILSGLTSSYYTLLVMMLLLGTGNSVFHPADYAILSARVDHSLLGRAFSLHTFSGHLGWAIAPAVMITLTAIWGWRPALIAVGLGGLLVLGAMLLYGRVLDDRPSPKQEKRRERGEESKDKASTASNVRLLFTAPMLLLFCYMIMASVAAIGLNSFTVVALVDLYDTSLDSANLVLTVFLSCSAGGVLLGGVTDQTARSGACRWLLYCRRRPGIRWQFMAAAYGRHSVDCPGRADEWGYPPVTRHHGALRSPRGIRGKGLWICDLGYERRRGYRALAVRLDPGSGANTLDLLCGGRRNDTGAWGCSAGALQNPQYKGRLTH